jgi:NAD(P)-dependent dehydrogenase (short-subunit alcohol dehydrogenase family)
VNITCTDAYRLFLGIMAYETSKFALLRLSELLQLEKLRLVVLAVNPGNVATEMGLQNPDEMHRCECRGSGNQ